MTYIDQIILVCQTSCSKSLSYNMLVAENQVVAEANPKLWVAKKTSMWLEKNQRRVCVLHACKLLGATIGSSAPPTGRACDVMPRGGFSVAAAEMLERAQALLQQALPKWEAF